MKFSVFTVGTPDYNIEQTVKKLNEYGYQGVEWRVNNSLKKEPEIIPAKEVWYWQYNKSTVDIDTILESAEQIKAICNNENIEICGLATYLSASDTEKVEKVLKAAAIMECPRIRVQVPGYNGTVNYRELFAKTVEEFKILQHLAEKYSVKVNIEIHHGTIIPSASAAYRLVSNFDSKHIGVIYDAGNMVHEGYEQYKMGLELLGEYVDHIHIKSAAYNVNGEAGWSPLRKGHVKFNNLFKAIKAINYEGYLSFEDFSNEKSTDEKLKDNLVYIKEVLSEVK
jgi:sugar phosphate isomerase/epimerase